MQMSTTGRRGTHRHHRWSGPMMLLLVGVWLLCGTQGAAAETRPRPWSRLAQASPLVQFNGAGSNTVENNNAVTAPALAPRLRQLADDNNKNNDNNKGVAITMSPTPVPTSVPTKRPTSTPTNSPTTRAPSQAPIAEGDPTASPVTASPTTLDMTAVGSISVRFSILAAPQEQDGLSSFSVLSGNEPAVVEAVLQSVLGTFCSQTDFVIYADQEAADPTNYCDRRRRSLLGFNNNNNDNEITSRFLDEYETILVGDPNEAFLDVRDDEAISRNYAVQWMEWKITYPVLKVGRMYQLIALDEEEIQDEGPMDPELLAKSLAVLENEANLAISMEIQSGTMMDRLAARSKDRILSVALVGAETKTFPQALGAWEAKEGNTLDASIKGGYMAPMEVDPFHTIRISGMAMLAITVAAVSILFIAADRRKKEREFDKKFMTIGKGGLGTEEGLDYMLDQGRKQSLTPMTSPSDSPEGTNHLPMVHDKDMLHLHSRLGLFAGPPSPTRKVGISSNQEEEEFEMEYTGHLRK